MLIRQSSKKQEGQTSVEYVLLFAVMAVMILGLTRRLKEYLVGESDRCPNESIACKILDRMKGPNLFDGTYRYFTIRR